MILLAAATFLLLPALANALFWPRVRQGASVGPISLAILIPARNEEANLPECLLSAVATTASEILVYDDHSSDGTARVARAFGAVDSRVRLIEPRPLPARWAGKTFACHTLAGEAQSEWMLFLDADARVTRDAPAHMVGEAVRRGLTFLSCWPAFDMRTLDERVLMPMLNFVVFTLFPGPLSLVHRSPSLGIAHGACILAHRETYRCLGGHEMVSDEIFEDTRLAQAWRAAGERGLCLDGQELVRVRMYRDAAEIWRGFQKNFYPAFRRNLSFAAFLALHGGVFLSPFFTGAWGAALLVLAARVLIAIRFRHPLWSVLAHPAAEAFTIALGVVSFWRCAFRRSVAWKGRVYRTT